jgi:hypothetical protein
MMVKRVVPILRGERRRANSDARFNEELLEDLGERRSEILRGKPFCRYERVRFSMMGEEQGPDSWAIIAERRTHALMSGYKPFSSYRYQGMIRLGFRCESDIDVARHSLWKSRQSMSKVAGSQDPS